MGPFAPHSAALGADSGQLQALPHVYRGGPQCLSWKGLGGALEIELGSFGVLWGSIRDN